MKLELLFNVAIGIILLGCSTTLRADQPRYWALFDNGDQHTGDKVDDWFHPDQMTRLNGRNLLDEGNPVRVVHDRQSATLEAAAHIELANGDILPGHVERFEPATSSTAAALVIATPLAGPRQSVRVRAEFVRRIAAHGEKAEYAPGYLQTLDGKRQMADRLRLDTEAIRGLTASGTVAASYRELREAHFPVAERLAAWRDAIWLPSFEPQQFFIHLRTRGGARLTFPRALATGEIKQPSGSRSPLFVAQPFWALDPLHLTHDEVSVASYFRLRELPLSIFEPSMVEERAAISHWNWRANAGLHGGLLATGKLTADLGLATHSFTALTFTLPPQAEEFLAIVGIDPACRDGGCARARVHREAVSGPLVWQSDFLRGGQDPVRVGPLDVRGAKQIVLVTDFAHQDRPAGADPWDVRDFVNWLMPIVRLQGEAWRQGPARNPVVWTPELAGWTIAEPPPAVSLRPYRHKKDDRYALAMVPTQSDKPQEAAPLKLTRRVKIDWTNAWLSIEAGRDLDGDPHHEINVLVNGEPFSCVNGPLETKRTPGTSVPRDWLLGQFAGQEIEVSVLIEPRGSGTVPGLLFDRFDFIPVVQGLGADGRPLHPDVALESLTPVNVAGLPDGQTLQSGKRTDGEPLVVREFPLAAGYGVPVNTSITYELKPEYRRFVAVVGLVNEVGGVGPFEILLDDKPHFSTPKDQLFKRPDRGEQLSIEIPPGHKTLTLKLSGERDFGSWGEAGFLLQ